jgi:hypothetical protein
MRVEDMVPVGVDDHLIAERRERAAWFGYDPFAVVRRDRATVARSGRAPKTSTSRAAVARGFGRVT